MGQSLSNVDFRPSTLNDIIGNEMITGNLKINCEVSRIKGEAIPHTLLSGPSGTGKSTYALAIANEIGTKCHTVNGANMKSPQYILPVLLKLQERDVLFIDEVHRLKIQVEEFLYIPMEDFKVYISTKEKSVILNLPHFTLIGATTNTGGLSKPLRGRFPLQEVLSLYNDSDICKIIRSNLPKVGLTIDDDAVKLLARCSRGTPRLSVSLLRWVDAVATAERNIKRLNIAFVKYCLYRKGIDDNGLNEIDRRYLDYLRKSNEPVGIETISAYLQIDRRAIEETIEPYLLQQGMLIKTKKGRVCI